MSVRSVGRALRWGNIRTQANRVYEHPKFVKAFRNPRFHAGRTVKYSAVFWTAVACLCENHPGLVPSLLVGTLWELGRQLVRGIGWLISPLRRAKKAKIEQTDINKLV